MPAIAELRPKTGCKNQCPKCPYLQAREAIDKAVIKIMPC
jgi:bacterioferritin-associated ferredoxin